MKNVLRRRPSASMVVAMMALVVAMSGTAIAASQMSGDKLIKKHSLSANRLRNHTITGTQINLGSLGKVPSAKNADHATTAGVAGSATTAGVAGSATNAGHASNSDALQGHPAGDFASSKSFISSGIVTIPAGTSATLLPLPGFGAIKVSCDLTSGVYNAKEWIEPSVGHAYIEGGSYSPGYQYNVDSSSAPAGGTSPATSYFYDDQDEMWSPTGAYQLKSVFGAAQAKVDGYSNDCAFEAQAVGGV